MAVRSASATRTPPSEPPSEEVTMERKKKGKWEEVETGRKEQGEVRAGGWKVLNYKARDGV